MGLCISSSISLSTRLTSNSPNLSSSTSAGQLTTSSPTSTGQLTTSSPTSTGQLTTSTLDSTPTLNATSLSAPPDSSTQSSSTSNPDHHLLTTLSLAVGVPLGFLAIGVVAFLFYRGARQKLSAEKTSAELQERQPRASKMRRSIQEMPLRPPELRCNDRHEMQVSTLTGHP